MKKILVIDGNSIINRAFYGIRSLSTSQGKPTNAIYGMINIISRQLDAVKPDYVAAAFDLHAPTFRKVMYPAYKEGRHPTPPELLAQFDDAKECLRLMGIKTLELEGYEADDIQGTIAKWADGDGELFSYVLSGDRDLLQLIDDRINVLLATNNDTVHFDRDAFYEKYGIEPARLVDAKALMGDSSDNIPGVAGIGEKTALKLISQFGSLDGIYGQIDSPDIAAKAREKLQNDKETAYLCYKLAKIETNAPVGVTLSDIEYKGFDRAGLFRKFRELEFNALIKKFGLSEDSEEKKAEDIKEEQAEEKACPCVNFCEEYKDIPDPAELVSLAGDCFAIEISGDTVYISGKCGCYSHSGIQKELAPLFAEGKTVICYDSKRLWHILRKNGIELCAIPRDIMLYAYVINSSLGARSWADVCLSEEGVTLSEGDSGVSLMPTIYARLREKAQAEGCLALIEQVELPLAIILAEVEDTGFYIDVEGMRTLSAELESAIAECEAQIYTLAGMSFNINSPKQLASVLTEELGIPLKKKTKSGFSTDVEALEQVRLYHPVIDEILEYRKLTKLHSTYAVGLLHAADGSGRVHTEFRQAHVATGRLSSTEPNLQNIPIKTALGKRIRAQFSAEGEDYVLVDADYSQIELRLLAYMSGDAVMTDAFINGADIHARTASAVFGIPEYAVSEEYRKRAKAVNFGIVYGIGAYSLSSDLKISMGQAKQYIESYFIKYPGIKQYLDAVVEGASEVGYTMTLFGRRRYIPELQSSKKQLKEFGKRVAMNSPIQGTAADIMKIAMLNVANRLKREGLDARIVMQVHDELVIEAHRDCAEAVKAAVVEEMQNAASLTVPLTVDATVTKRWYEL